MSKKYCMFCHEHKDKVFGPIDNFIFIKQTEETVEVLPYICSNCALIEYNLIKENIITQFGKVGIVFSEKDFNITNRLIGNCMGYYVVLEIEFVEKELNKEEKIKQAVDFYLNIAGFIEKDRVFFKVGNVTTKSQMIERFFN